MSGKRKEKRQKRTLDLTSALEEIERLNVEDLRARWRHWLGADPPPCQSGRVLRYLLA
nr:hypothetical protein [Nitrosomonas nitrosa]